MSRVGRVWLSSRGMAFWSGRNRVDDRGCPAVAAPEQDALQRKARELAAAKDPDRLWHGEAHPATEMLVVLRVLLCYVC